MLIYMIDTDTYYNNY